MTLPQSLNLSEPRFPQIQHGDTTTYINWIRPRFKVSVNLIKHLEQSPAQRALTPPNAALRFRFISSYFFLQDNNDLPGHCGSAALLL